MAEDKENNKEKKEEELLPSNDETGGLLDDLDNLNKKQEGEVAGELEENLEGEEADGDLPRVASPDSKNKSMVILAAVGVIAVSVVISLFSGDDGAQNKNVKLKTQKIEPTQVQTEQSVKSMNIPVLEETIVKPPELNIPDSGGGEKKADSGPVSGEAPPLPSIPGFQSGEKPGALGGFGSGTGPSGQVQQGQAQQGQAQQGQAQQGQAQQGQAQQGQAQQGQGPGGITIQGNVPGGSLPPLPVFSGTSQVSPEQMASRIKSPMLLGAAGGDLGKLFGDGDGGSGGKGGVDGGSPVQVLKSRKLEDTTIMISQGKIIDAVLESGINTDFPGDIRAVVSRDVYAESGRKILIPKGSRLIGQYNAEVKRGQGRVIMIWNRVIRPDGIDISLGSYGVDLLGKQGLTGAVDNKYFDIFSNAILFSVFNYAFAVIAEGATGSEGVTETENPSGSRTVSGKASDKALSESVSNFGGVVKSIAQDLVSLKPTMTIDQGTRLKIFVNKDLLFKTENEDDEGESKIGAFIR